MAARFEMIKNTKFNLTYMDSPTHVKITDVSDYNKSAFRYFTKLSQDQLVLELYDFFLKFVMKEVSISHNSSLFCSKPC